ncbi:MAG: phosphonoacetaldehyde reductase [Bacteroidales bacterium]|nr:phosphonoacetaldehyde reductase [Bacteroidales bacterium]
MNKQEILSAGSDYAELDACLTRRGVHRLLLVCGRSIERLPLWDYFCGLPARLGIDVVRFSDFKPNPDYESAVRGVELYRKRLCDAIVAVGGGSAMDTAKCIKLYAEMDPAAGDYMLQEIVPNDVLLIAVPTTAGTGSEVTRYAIVYYHGVKTSVTDYSCIPQVVLFDPTVLETLPEYQRKVTMLDALCHAVESYWSVQSTAESKVFAEQAIRMVFKHLDSYLANEPEGNAGMLEASNLAGKAINITQTTAGHAMSYVLTARYHLAHGHAVALCVDSLWPFMLEHPDLCSDARGEAYLRSTLVDLGRIFLGEETGCKCGDDGCDCVEDGWKAAVAAMEKFRKLVADMDLERPAAAPEDFEILKNSVNAGRLKNHPVTLSPDTIDLIYHQILR